VIHYFLLQDLVLMVVLLGHLLVAEEVFHNPHHQIIQMVFNNNKILGQLDHLVVVAAVVDHQMVAQQDQMVVVVHSNKIQEVTQELVADHL
jgi:hypothetical protein